MSRAGGRVGGLRADLRALAATIYRRRSGTPSQRMHAEYVLLDRLRRHVMPDYLLTDFGRAWWEDTHFFELYHRLEGEQVLTADRKYLLRELLKLVAHLDGDTAEAGVYRGSSSWFICEGRRERGSTHWGFDSFEGLSEPRSIDSGYWHAGDMLTGPEPARRLLEPFGAVVLEGWIPAVFDQADIDALAFSHIDVDLYDPTLASLEFFYPKTVAGGIIVCDDYGLTTCPGATQAFDEYMAGRPEPIVRCPTGQAFICKR